MRREIGTIGALVVLGCGPRVMLDDAGGGGGSDESTGTGGSISASDSANGSANDSVADSANDSAPTVPGTTDTVSITDSDPQPTTVSTVDPDDTGAEVTTTPVDPGCGDGEVENDEECDDGNTDDGDACSAQCTNTREVTWTVTFDGTASSFDKANDVVLADDGSVWVVGTTRSADTHDDVWVQNILPDGTLGASTTWDAGGGLSDVANAVVWAPDGTLVITGSTESEATGDDLLVMKVDPNTLAVVWAWSLDGAGSGGGEFDDVDIGNDVAIGSDGEILVGATMRVGPGNFDAHVLALDADAGPPLWSHGVPGAPGERDESRAIVSTASSTILVAAFDDDADAGLVYFDGNGGLQATVASSWLPDDAAVLGDGLSLALTGIDGPENSAEILVQVLDQGGAPQWTATIVTPGNHDGQGLGIAVGPDDEVVAVGVLGVPGEQNNALVRAFHPDGTPWWGDDYDNPDASLADQFEAVVIDGTGDVIAVGWETVIGEQTNALVMKYRPM